MTLIKTISGIRGTIGGKPGDAFTPVDMVKYAAAFGTLLKQINPIANKIVVGRDARISGEIVTSIVSATLQSLGFDVIDLGLTTTPTVEIAVPDEGAAGGIIFSASHNPIQWNALKLLNEKGEFISAALGQQVLDIADENKFEFAEVLKLGSFKKDNTYFEKHIQKILDLPLVNVAAIKNMNFKVAVDAVNSSGGIAVPMLLKALGVTEISKLYCEPTGHFAHNPEPLPENLTEITSLMEKGGHDLGIIVDPDVDRLAFISEDGSYFGEEYTLVAVAEYVLKHTPGNTVSNLSSTRALRDVTIKAGGSYSAAAVGEVNVVTKMKETNTVIGGEGNGGIIYPELHYGRDSLVGIALFLSHLAELNVTASALRKSLPNYFISKNKIELTPLIDVDAVISHIGEIYKNEECNTIDGLKIDFENGWVHLRKSNTEPIIRIYSEASTEKEAQDIAQMIIKEVDKFLLNK